MTRLSREEQRERTRVQLLEAAAGVFARKGYHGTSVDEVAEAAGYTKGAVYSNFDSKEQLFLALIDRHLAQAVDTLAEVLAQAEPAQRAELVGQRHAKMTVFDRDWLLLETEFLLYAARNEDVRAHMAQRQRDIRARVTELLEQHLADLRRAPRVPVEDLTRLLIAAGDGLTIMSLAEPTETEAGRLLTRLVELLVAAGSEPGGG